MRVIHKNNLSEQQHCSIAVAVHEIERIHLGYEASHEREEVVKIVVEMQVTRDCSEPRVCFMELLFDKK